MRVFFAVSVIPAAAHRIGGAVTMVAYEAAAAFRELGHEVVVQPILDLTWGGGELGAQEQADLEALAGAGFDVEEPLWTPHWGGSDERAAVLRRAFAPTLESFYPAAGLAGTVAGRIDARGCDLVFHVWSPESLAACSSTDRPVFAYQGNPDHLPTQARLKHPELFDIPLETLKHRAALAVMRRGAANWRRFHLKLMRTVHWTANNSALDAAWYSRCGHPRSHYLQNMWSDLYVESWRERRDRAADGARAIVGSIGNLRSTANSFGLHFLGREIVPALERRLGDDFTVDVLGPGEPHTAVAAALDHPRIRRRGWVEDIDRELSESGIFLLANNNCPDFRVGHTRVLHAWTLGVCLVAHEAIRLAMPEIEHGVNALLGRTGEELADHLVAVLQDRDLRHRLGGAGRATYERSFTPRFVIGRALEILGS